MQAVARRFAVSVSVVARAWRRYQETDQYTRRCGGGRRRNQLHEDGIRARRPQIGVVLTVQHRAGRLSFARELQDWQIHHWCPVLFTDESRFTQSTCDRRHRVWRCRGERSAACNILQHERFGSGSVMLWGGICLEGRTALHVLARGILTAIGYRDEILRPLVRPYAGAVGPGFLLTQDNARPHVAGVCQQFLQDEGIEAMDWPARSPDLNPIEHIWDIMSRCIHQRHIAPQTVQELADALVQNLLILIGIHASLNFNKIPSPCTGHTAPQHDGTTTKFYYLDDPWRPVNWSEKEKILKDLNDIKPHLQPLRILLHGPVGAGKSCFINTVQRALIGRNVISALENSTISKSFTLSIKTHKMQKLEGGYHPFVFCDIMGLEADITIGTEGVCRERQPAGIQTEDIVKVLEGHILDGYEFVAQKPITEDHPKYKLSPDPCDKIHCLISIGPADAISRMDCSVIEKMKAVRKKASELNIPQVIVLTKVDKACELVSRDLRKLYYSRKIREKVEISSYTMGIPVNNIYPVKNYHEEVTEDENIDVIILKALRDIFYFANDYALKTHKMKKRENGRYPFVFCDIMGLEPDSGGIQTGDIIKVLEGHILDDYKFNPRAPITEDNPKYKQCPKPCDKIHCLVSIVPADAISGIDYSVIEKMKTVRNKASELNIPQVTVLTKVDKACEVVSRDLTRLYHSRRIGEKLEQSSHTLGIPLDNIYPMKNYHAEINKDDSIDVIILMALRNIVHFASDYAESLCDDE
ncbi:hypothetical protein NFI96_004455 [Prochilodus magdalenae]|nr:hypothetical protein NFI96_004455 [Prochilodus magdalenae]